MQLTGFEIFQTVQPLADFCKDYKLPVKAAYRLSRILKKTQEEFKLLDEQRNALIKQYGKAQEDGSFRIDPIDKENFENFKTKMDELLAEKIEVDLEPVSIEVLNGIDVKPAELFILDKFFTEKE